MSKVCFEIFHSSLKYFYLWVILKGTNSVFKSMVTTGSRLSVLISSDASENYFLLQEYFSNYLRSEEELSIIWNKSELQGHFKLILFWYYQYISFVGRVRCLSLKEKIILLRRLHASLKKHVVSLGANFTKPD